MNDIFEQSTVTSVSAMLVRVVSFKGLSGSGWGGVAKKQRHCPYWNLPGRVSPDNKGLLPQKGINLRSDRELASPARLFFEGSEEHIIPEGNFSVSNSPFESHARLDLT